MITNHHEHDESWWVVMSHVQFCNHLWPLVPKYIIYHVFYIEMAWVISHHCIRNWVPTPWGLARTWFLESFLWWLPNPSERSCFVGQKWGMLEPHPTIMSFHVLHTRSPHHASLCSSAASSATLKQQVRASKMNKWSNWYQHGEKCFNHPKLFIRLATNLCKNSWKLRPRDGFGWSLKGSKAQILPSGTVDLGPRWIVFQYRQAGHLHEKHHQNLGWLFTVCGLLSDCVKLYHVIVMLQYIIYMFSDCMIACLSMSLYMYILWELAVSQSHLAKGRAKFRFWEFLAELLNLLLKRK